MYKRNPSIIGLLVVFTITILTVHCGKSPQSAIMDDELVEWTESLTRHRQDKNENYRDFRGSPMAAETRLTIEPAGIIYITMTDDEIKATKEKSKNTLLELNYQEENWSWKKTGDAVKAMEKAEEKEQGSFEEKTEFSTERFQIRSYPSREDMVLYVFDKERKKLKEFQELLYYEPDRNYAVHAVLEKISDPDKITMSTSRNLKKEYYRYAALKFEIEGTPCQLIAYKSDLEAEDSKWLFVPFSDKTNGSGTYPAGRFLYIEETGKDKLLLDFNYAFNPLCNYSKAYNCPIPPMENALKIEIKAGEKKYPH